MSFTRPSISAASQTAFSEGKGLPDLLFVIEQAASKFKTPPATEVADGAFELIFPVDFSFLLYLLGGPTRIFSTRSVTPDFLVSRRGTTGRNENAIAVLNLGLMKSEASHEKQESIDHTLRE
jgi:hypothetical protein